MSQYNLNPLSAKNLRIVFSCFIAVLFMIPLKTAMAGDPLTINLSDQTRLDPTTASVWVAGYVSAVSANMQVLQLDTPGSHVGTFVTPTTNPISIPFLKVGAAAGEISSLSLASMVNAGNNALVFVVSLDKPNSIQAPSDNPVRFTQYPYSDTPGTPVPGPFEIFEFGYGAAADISNVSGFGLNLSFTVTPGTGAPNTPGAISEKYGANPLYSRSQIGEAFKTFVDNEAISLASAAAYKELFYDQPIVLGAPAPPLVGGQYFAISDPNDMLAAKSANYTGTTTDPLATYWDDTLNNFFVVGKHMSINLNAGNPPLIYSGSASMQTNPITNVSSPAFTLTTTKNGTTYSYTYFKPLSIASPLNCGLTGAKYVFQQMIPNNFCPNVAGDGGDAWLIQDNIFEALCRGVAVLGLSDTAITNGETTTQWNEFSNWYPAGTACHIYSKFLHYSTIDGKDSRLVANSTPIFFGNSAYGFSLDEDPNGPYLGTHVPSKTLGNVPGGSTINLVIGPFDDQTPGTHAISGTVTNSSGSAGVGDVTMTLSDASTGTATTGANGAYSFSNLLNGTYVITPVLAGYTFSPPYSTVHINNADPLSQNFTATAIVPNTFTISGTVTNSSGSAGLADVTMSLSGGSIQTATTHTDGTYHFGNLPQGTYTVTPTPTDDHTFSPKSKRNIMVGPSATADFKAIPASLGTLVAHGLDFPIYANELNPPQVTFMDNPVVHARYLHDGKSAETKLKVLTKVDKNTGSPSINSLWTKRIRLYNSEDFKEAQKNGSDALDWLANSANQSRLLMSLYLKAKDVEDQMIGQLTLEEPVISNITPGLDANDNEVLIITGNWIGTTDVRVWREFIAEEGIAIKKQTMNVVKPTRANAEGYTDHEGKPAFMNSESGASKLIVRVPKKDPKGTLNGNIVIENGAAMAAYSIISIPPQPSTENNDSIIVRSGKPTVPAVEGGVQNQSGAMYSNTNAYSNGTQSLAVGVEQQWIGYGQPLDNVAVNWMTCFNFSPLEWAMSGNQKQHQPEGIAKLMDIVKLYGWDGINACSTNSVGADTETLFSDDEKVLQLCKSMGKDLRPLLYFWGILPANSANLAAQVAAAGLTPPTEIRDLLYHYKALVPADNAAFRSFCMNYYGHQPSMGGFCFEQDHARQWSTDLLWSPDVQLSEPYQVRFPTEIYDETASAEVKARVQEIINTYWNPADLNLDRVVNGADLALMLSESWGPCGTNCLQDLNLDGVVNGADFNLMMSAWGSTTN